MLKIINDDSDSVTNSQKLKINEKDRDTQIQAALINNRIYKASFVTMTGKEEVKKIRIGSALKVVPVHSRFIIFEISQVRWGTFCFHINTATLGESLLVDCALLVITVARLDLLG